MSPILLGALLAGLAAFLALALHDRRLALAVFVALLPTYLLRLTIPIPGIGAFPTTVLELLFAELFLVWLCMDGLKRGAWTSLDRWALPITLFVTGSTVALAVSPDLRGAFGLWRAYIVEPLLFFVLFTDVVTRARRGTWPIAALGATLAVVGAIAIYQKLTGFGIPNPMWQAEATRRVTAFYGFPNAIGLFGAPVTVLMAAWTIALVSAKKWKQRALAALPAGATIFGAAGIFFAVSEGAIFGTLAGLGLLGLLHKKLRPWTLGATIAACIVVMAWAPARNYASMIVSLRDDSGSVRQIIWSETITMLADHPVFGAGLSGYPGRILPYHAATWIEVFQYPHTIVLNFWSEIGLIGLVGFFWIIIRFFIESARLYRASRSWLPAALIAAMAAILVHGLVDVPYFKNDLAMQFWLLIGLAEAMRRVEASKLEAFAEIVKEKIGWK